MIFSVRATPGSQHNLLVNLSQEGVVMLPLLKFILITIYVLATLVYMAS